MKKKFLLMFVALLFVALKGWTQTHGPVYSENFDGSTTSLIATGWSGYVISNTTIIDGDVGPLTTWGGVAQPYHTQSVAGDRAFGFYKSSDANPAWIQLAYTSTKTLTNISVKFDLESTWLRNSPSGTKNLGFNNLMYSTNGGSTWTTLGTVGPVTFSTSASIPASTWLSDAQMDANGLSSRNITFVLPGLTLNTSDVLLIRWDCPYSLSNSKNIQTNIDNFSLIADYTPPPPIHNVTQNTYFNTIQPAINAANANEVIEVAAGTYTEMLDVNKSVTILGPNAAISPNGGSRVAEAIIDLTGGNQIRIGADNIILKGFKIVNLNQQGAIIAGGGLSATTAAANVTIEKNLFDNLTGNAIYTYGSVSNWTITDNKIQNVAYFSGGGGYGSAMGFWLNANGLTITNNTISNIAWEGIQFICYQTGKSTSNALIQNNTITNVAHSGINIACNLNNVDVLGNTITNANTSLTANEGGILIQGLGIVVDAVVSGNTISGSNNGITIIRLTHKTRHKSS
jgi:hypothetical protein